MKPVFTSLGITVTIAINYTLFALLFLPTLSADARPCGTDPLSRLGCAIDPTNPSSNGGVVPDAARCKNWWNCDPNQIQINQAVIAARQSGLIKNREECKAYVSQTIGLANEQLQGLPGLDFFLRRGTSQGNDSCDVQFSSKPPSNGGEGSTIPGSVDPPQQSGIALHNQWSGKCLQTMGQAKDNGSPVNIWDCSNTSNQFWR